MESSNIKLERNFICSAHHLCSYSYNLISSIKIPLLSCAQRVYDDDDDDVEREEEEKEEEVLVIPFVVSRSSVMLLDNVCSMLE